MNMNMIYKANNSLVDVRPPESGKYTKEQLEAFVGGLFRIYFLNDQKILVAKVYALCEPARLNILATCLTARAGYREIILGDALVCSREHYNIE